MTRSYRHTPITGIATAASEKRDKQLAQRRWRHGVKEALRRGRPLPLLREVSDRWSMAKDGRRWIDRFWLWRRMEQEEFEAFRARVMRK